MPVERRFLVAPALARLIQRESTAMSRIVEGHFPPHPQRTQLVRVERDQALLILTIRNPDGTITEERAEVPITHAEALIDVAPGTIAFDRLPVVLSGGGRALLDRFIVPSGINLLTTVQDHDASSFEIPEWFGPEVTNRGEFEKSALALRGAPLTEEVPVSNRALENLLDTLDGQGGSWRLRPYQSPAPRPSAAPPAPAPIPAPVPDEPVPVAAAPEPAPAADETPAVEIAPAPEAAPERPAASAPTPAPRANVRELDDGIARLARSLAPRGARTP